jgi:hypothetical protein
MKKRLGLASACMAGILVPSRLPGALATLGAPIMALVRKRETGRASLTNFAILAAALTAVTAGSGSEAIASTGCTAFTGSSSGSWQFECYSRACRWWVHRRRYPHSYRHI